MRVLLRAVTVFLVLCVAALGVLIFRPARVALVPPPQAVDSVSASQAAQSEGQFNALASPLPAPALSIATRGGEAKTLADFKGSVLLVNLWATWCAPCVAEMPALDRLQEKMGSRLTVLAISEDRNSAVVDPFVAKLGLKTLAIYLDPKANASVKFGVQGLPTSYLIGRDGTIIGKLEGAAAWDAPKMVALLDGYIGKP